MKYHYFVKDIKPEDLETELQKFGSTSWELVQLIVIQKQIPTFTVSGQQGMKIEMQLKLIFKKTESCQE